MFKSSRTSNFIVDTDTGQILNQFGRLSESGNIRGDLRDAATQPAIDRALEIGEFLDKTFADISTAISETADRFGLSKDALNAVSVELDLMSEKGEAFTQEQIAEQIAHVSDEMVRGLIPTVDDLARIGESASQALSRFNADFQAVESAFIITGESAADALAKTQALSLEQRSAVTDRFGGAAGLQAELQSFFSNVLNESQQLEIVETRLTDVLQKAGIDFIPTIDQLVNAFQNGTPAVKALVLENDELITQYHALKGSVEGIGDVTGDVAENLTGRCKHSPMSGVRSLPGAEKRMPVIWLQPLPQQSAVVYSQKTKYAQCNKLLLIRLLPRYRTSLKSSFRGLVNHTVRRNRSSKTRLTR